VDAEKGAQIYGASVSKSIFRVQSFALALEAAKTHNFNKLKLGGVRIPCYQDKYPLQILCKISHFEAVYRM